MIQGKGNNPKLRKRLITEETGNRKQKTGNRKQEKQIMKKIIHNRGNDK